MLSKILSDSYLLTYTDTPFRGYLKGLLVFDKQQISRDSNKPPKELIIPLEASYRQLLKSPFHDSLQKVET
jgi:hypothetical protein